MHTLVFIFVHKIYCDQSSLYCILTEVLGAFVGAAEAATAKAAVTWLTSATRAVTTSLTLNALVAAVRDAKARAQKAGGTDEVRHWATVQVSVESRPALPQMAIISYLFARYVWLQVTSSLACAGEDLAEVELPVNTMVIALRPPPSHHQPLFSLKFFACSLLLPC